jgi:hypothetical protein
VETVLVQRGGVTEPPLCAIWGAQEKQGQAEEGRFNGQRACLGHSVIRFVCLGHSVRFLLLCSLDPSTQKNEWIITKNRQYLLESDYPYPDTRRFY